MTLGTYYHMPWKVLEFLLIPLLLLDFWVSFFALMIKVVCLFTLSYLFKKNFPLLHSSDIELVWDEHPCIQQHCHFYIIY